MGFVGFEEVEMTKTEESLTDLDQVIIKDSFLCPDSSFSRFSENFVKSKTFFINRPKIWIRW